MSDEYVPIDRTSFTRCSRCGAEGTPEWTARIGDVGGREGIVMCEHCMTPAERAAHDDELRRGSREMRADIAAQGSTPDVQDLLERVDAMNEADALPADELEEPRGD